MADKSGEVRDSGSDEHLTGQAIPESMRAALEAAAGRQEEKADVIAEARAAGLVGDVEMVTVAEAQGRLAHLQAEEARQTIAASEPAEPAVTEPGPSAPGPSEPGPAAATPSSGRERQHGQGGERGPRMVESKFAPGTEIPRLGPGDTELIQQAIGRYALALARDDLTAQQALHLVMDARAQNLYRFDQQTENRTPMRVDDQALQRSLVELFGEGTDNPGMAEQRLQGLRAAERAAREARRSGRPDRPATNAGDHEERPQWSDEDLRGLIDAFEVRINELNDSNPDSREGWKEILDDFIAERLYRDNEVKSSNIGDQELRTRANALYRQARQGYLAATQKAGVATTGGEALAHGWKRDAGKPPDTSGEPASSDTSGEPASGGAPERKKKEKKLSAEARAAQGAYDLDDYAAQKSAGDAEYADIRDPDGSLREAELKRTGPRTGPPSGALDRLETRLAGDEPESEPDTRPTEYDSGVENAMEQAYRRDPVARGVEMVRRRLQAAIDKVMGKVSPDELERMRGRQQDLMKIERDKLQAIQDEKARAKMRQAEIDRLKGPGRG